MAVWFHIAVFWSDCYQVSGYQSCEDAACFSNSDTTQAERCYYPEYHTRSAFNPYPTAFPYGNGMVLHFYQQQESSTTKTVHKVINKGLKAYV